MNAAADRRAVLDAIIAAVEEEVGRRGRRALALGPDLQSSTLEIAAGARLLASFGKELRFVGRKPTRSLICLGHSS